MKVRISLFSIPILAFLIVISSCKKQPKDVNNPFNNYYAGTIVLGDSVQLGNVTVNMRNGDEKSEVRFTVQAPGFVGWDNVVLDGPIYDNDFIIPRQGNRLNTLNSQPQYYGSAEKRDLQLRMTLYKIVTGVPDQVVHIYANGQ